MKRPRLVIASALLLAAVKAAFAASVANANEDLQDYRTVETAIRTSLRTNRGATGLTGYLGISLEPDKRGKLVVTAVSHDSAAARAGVARGDVLIKVGGRSVRSADEVRTFVQASPIDEPIKLALQRGRKSLELTATLVPVSRPMLIGEARAIIGVRMGAPGEGVGIPINSVTTNKPAAKAGLKAGDVILSVDGVELGEALSLSDKFSEYRPGDSVKLRVRRGRSVFVRNVKLAADDGGSIPFEERRTLNPWTNGIYRLAVLLVEFPDVKHNENVAVRDWENAYFSRGTYTTTNATGQTVYGSMADFYQEVSCGKLRIEGRVFDWVQAPKKRTEYNQNRTGTTRSSLFSNVVAAVQARDGAEALKGFDGLAVIYAGERFPGANRGSILWPHRSSITVQRKQWPYVIVAEGGRQMGNISVMCHETGHILGLPDLYARPENPGSEGAGGWCLMSNESRGGRPQHFSAWCKEQLGWLNPAVIDPAVKQKLILRPIEGTTNECFKVLVRGDGSEYFLLENRRKQGFDASLPAEGLLIWRVVANRPILEEAHGVEGPVGPRVYLNSVPFPSKANSSFTPYTTPSSRSQLGGGAPVFISNIRRIDDGRIAFEIGYEFE